MKTLISIVLLGLALTFPQAIYAARNSMEQVRLILQWMPQAQFAGYFVALDKGFYRNEGIDLTIIPGGPDRIVSEYLQSGKADFGTMFLAAALERYDEGMPLVNVGQIIHNSTLMLVAKRDGAIYRLQDLDQKKVSLWSNEFQTQAHLLFKHLQIDVEFIPLASSMDLFLRDGVSATSAMWYNEYHSILGSGFRETELMPFFFKDTPFNFPEDGIYCLQETYSRNPEIARGLLKGTLAGWEYAFSHVDETLAIVHRHMEAAHLPINKAHQRWMLNRMADTIITGKTIANHGILDRKAFNRVNQQLQKGGVIKKPVDYDIFYQGLLHD